MTGETAVKSERRSNPRKPAVMAVSLDSAAKTGRHGVTRDLSTNGLLIVTPSQFTPGDRVDVKLIVGGETASFGGHVRRVDVNPISSPELWRYRVGVELDEPLPRAVFDSADPASKPS